MGTVEESVGNVVKVEEKIAHWFQKAGWLFSQMGVSENRENPIFPNGFADHYPRINGYFIGNIAYFQTNPDCGVGISDLFSG